MSGENYWCLIFFVLTFWRLAQWRISEHKTVNQAQTLIEAESLIEPLNRHFWVGAVVNYHPPFSSLCFKTIVK